MIDRVAGEKPLSAGCARYAGKTVHIVQSVLCRAASQANYSDNLLQIYGDRKSMKLL